MDNNIEKLKIEIESSNELFIYGTNGDYKELSFWMKKLWNGKCSAEYLKKMKLPPDEVGYLNFFGQLFRFVGGLALCGRIAEIEFVIMRCKQVFDLCRTIAVEHRRKMLSDAEKAQIEAQIKAHRLILEIV